MYLNTSDGVVKTFLANGVSPGWYEYGSIMGPAGATGATGATGEQGPAGATGADGVSTRWYNGSVAPESSAEYNEHDYYLDSVTGSVYEYESDDWTEVANIMGPAGPSGSGGGDATKITDGNGDTISSIAESNLRANNTDSVLSSGSWGASSDGDFPYQYQLTVDALAWN